MHFFIYGYLVFHKLHKSTVQCLKNQLINKINKTTELMKSSLCESAILLEDIPIISCHKQNLSLIFSTLLLNLRFVSLHFLFLSSSACARFTHREDQTGPFCDVTLLRSPSVIKPRTPYRCSCELCAIKKPGGSFVTS